MKFTTLMAATIMMSAILLRGDSSVMREWADTMVQVVHESERLADVGKPFVTFFGGHKLGKDDPYYSKAYNLAHNLAEQGYAVITGGGPGLMEAGNCGAASVKGQGVTSVGINVKNLDAEGLNSCVQLGITMDNFLSRKWLFRWRTEAFVVFPGGFGTIDELSEILTLMSTHQIEKKPIYVMGKEYWDLFLNKWVRDVVHEKGLIKDEVLSLFTVTDDEHEIEQKILDAAPYEVEEAVMVEG